MNYLFLLAEELQGLDSAIISGKRLEFVKGRHQLGEGRELNIGVFGGALGGGVITKSEPDRLEIALRLDRAIIPRRPITLLVGLSRPQTVKKLLRFSASAALTAVHFVRCRNSEKSYLDANVLSSERIREELLKGMEQSGSTSVPDVQVHHRFHPFIDELTDWLRVDGEEKYNLALLAHTAGGVSTVAAAGNLSGVKHIFLIIGAESGWSDYEITQLKGCGCKMITLGRPQLRVEDAAVTLVGQALMLLEMLS